MVSFLSALPVAGRLNSPFELPKAHKKERTRTLGDDKRHQQRFEEPLKDNKNSEGPKTRI
jgi:hypothetical protein